VEKPRREDAERVASRELLVTSEGAAEGIGCRVSGVGALDTRYPIPDTRSTLSSAEP